MGGEKGASFYKGNTGKEEIPLTYWGKVAGGEMNTNHGALGWIHKKSQGNAVGGGSKKERNYK